MKTRLCYGKLKKRGVMAVKKKRKIIAWAVAAAAAVLLVVWMIWGNTALELNTYTVSSDRLPEAFDGYRIAHISDLHNTQIGKNNEKLTKMIEEAEPDIIAITGDLIDSRRTDIAVALQFAEKAMEIAPCYYVTGNHEGRISAYPELEQGLIALGVVVLNDGKIEIARGEETISVLGVNDPSFQTDYLFGDAAAVMDSALQQLRGEESYTVLLSHRPELLDVYAQNDIDLALSGHAHGGQIRLPLIGGLIAPNQGLFPRYDAGIYTQGNTHMVVSRGIGNSILPLRFNNPPEVILIELTR